MASCGRFRHVLGLELSPIAQRRFEERRDQIKSVLAGDAQVSLADFFTYAPPAAERFDFIFDYTYALMI